MLWDVSLWLTLIMQNTTPSQGARPSFFRFKRGRPMGGIDHLKSAKGRKQGRPLAEKGLPLRALKGENKGGPWQKKGCP